MSLKLSHLELKPYHLGANELIDVHGDIMAMETLSASLAIFAGKVINGFSHKGLVMRSFEDFFAVSLNKLLSKQWSWWDLRPRNAHVTSL